MVIVDTSIWIESWRKGHAGLAEWAAWEEVLQHPFVTQELGMGSFSSPEARMNAISVLESFEQFPVPSDAIFHDFVSEARLFGTGIGFADAHLLLACKTSKARLATRDKRLAEHAALLTIEVLS